jgi:hypothetical protein
VGNRKSGNTGYLTTPSGNLLILFPNGDGEFIINNNLENDRNDSSSPPSVMPVVPLAPMPIVPSPTPKPPTHFPDTPRL